MNYNRLKKLAMKDLLKSLIREALNNSKIKTYRYEKHNFGTDYLPPPRDLIFGVRFILSTPLTLFSEYSVTNQIPKTPWDRKPITDSIFYLGLMSKKQTIPRLINYNNMNDSPEYEKRPKEKRFLFTSSRREFIETPKNFFPTTPEDIINYGKILFESHGYVLDSKWQEEYIKRQETFWGKFGQIPKSVMDDEESIPDDEINFDDLN